METEEPETLYDRILDRWFNLALDGIFVSDEALEDAVVKEFQKAEPGVSERDLREMVRRAAAISVEAMLELNIDATLQDGSHIELAIDPETHRLVEKKTGRPASELEVNPETGGLLEKKS